MKIAKNNKKSDSVKKSPIALQDCTRFKYILKKDKVLQNQDDNS